MVCKISNWCLNAINVIFMSPLHGGQMIFTKCAILRMYETQKSTRMTHTTPFSINVLDPQNENAFTPQTLIPKFSCNIAMSQVGTLI